MLKGNVKYNDTHTHTHEKAVLTDMTILRSLETKTHPSNTYHHQGHKHFFEKCFIILFNGTCLS